MNAGAKPTRHEPLTAMQATPITFKRGTLDVCGVEENVTHVLSNGKPVLFIQKEVVARGFTAYTLDGQHYCGGFDVTLSEVKETILRNGAQ